MTESTTATTTAVNADSTDTTSEMILLQLAECFVYRLPPRTRSGGYRAEEWGLDHPIWTGRLRVIGQGDACFIRLEDTTTNELFAAGPYTPDGRAVETAIDSSRYFVLRVEDAGRHAFIGVGFRERNDAFDFNATLQAYLRHQRSLKEQASGKTVTTTSTPAMDYRLKEGETIHINIQGMPSKTTTSNHSSANTSLPLLPPPPSFTTPIPSEHVDSQDDDDFGDFMSA